MNSTKALTLEPVTLLNGDNDFLYEVVNGEKMELPPLGAFETAIGSKLLYYLGPFAQMHGLGRALAEMLFLLDRPNDLQRRPDVAVVSYKRWPKDRRVPRTSAWEVVPDLAVEIVSASNSAEAVLAKVREYFQAGVERVWVVYPTEELVYVYQSPVQNRILTKNDDLDGEEILPGFRLRVAILFDEEPSNS